MQQQQPVLLSTSQWRPDPIDAFVRQGSSWRLARGYPSQEGYGFRFGPYPSITVRHWASGARTNVWWKKGVSATCRYCNQAQLVYPTHEGRVENLRCRNCSN